MLIDALHRIRVRWKAASPTRLWHLLHDTEPLQEICVAPQGISEVRRRRAIEHYRNTLKINCHSVQCMAASRGERLELPNSRRNADRSGADINTHVRRERRHNTRARSVPERFYQDDRHAVRANACGCDRDSSADDAFFADGLSVLIAARPRLSRFGGA
jgi:hypothetical protein